MSYQQVKNLKPEDFKRLSGVRPETFTQMLEVVRSHIHPKKKTGRAQKLSWEDQLLMTLEYWREYRTYFHTPMFSDAPRACEQNALIMPSLRIGIKG